MILGGPKDTITSLWTKGLKALVPPNSFGPPTMVGVVVDFKDREGWSPQAEPTQCDYIFIRAHFGKYQGGIQADF